MQTNIHFWSHLAQFFLEWEMFQAKVEKNIKTHCFPPVTFFFDNRAVYEIKWKNIIQRGKPQINMAHVRCMLDN